MPVVPTRVCRLSLSRVPSSLSASLRLFAGAAGMQRRGRHIFHVRPFPQEYTELGEGVVSTGNRERPTGTTIQTGFMMTGFFLSDGLLHSPVVNIL